MFEITPSTFAVIENDSELRFRHKLANVLRDAVPSLRSEPPETFDPQLRLLIEQARSYGLASEQAIGSYAITAGLLGVDFADRLPGARQILAGHEPEARKADLLEAFTLNLLSVLDR